MEPSSVPVQIPGEKPSPGKAGRSVVRHARRSTKVLKEWFAAHSAHPYPSDQEKEELKERTGLSIRQISYWFVNARRRGGAKPLQELPTPTDESPMPTLVPGPEPSLGQNQGWSVMNPLDRWRHTPPEEEAVSLAAIANALGRADSMPDLTSSPLHDWTTAASWSYGPTIPPSGSDSSLGSSDQSHSSNSSAHSFASDSFLDARLQEGRRRRRRKIHKYRNPLNVTKDDHAKRIYQCTFCTDTFKSRYDWTRHEGTLHLVLEKWTCLPSGPKYCDPSGQVARCALCNEPNPSDEHIQMHKYHECAAKPLSARVFYRKDHLRQHLRLAHQVNEVLPSMNTWKSKITRLKSRCGFCGETFNLWSDRNDHLVDHYREGALIKAWKGCRGLEPAVALLVRNAMPPYLIGAEANNIEPFSASRAASQAPDADTSGPNMPSQFESLTARLGDYIKIAIDNFEPVTDDSIRREARMILYGDDDPWNQTPADNAEWLRLFKAGYGLASETPAQTFAGLGIMDSIAGQWDTLPPMDSTIMAPFTFENMQHAATSSSADISLDFCGSALNGLHGDGLNVPWSWQTPECLAEFRQMNCMLSMNTTDFDESCDQSDPCSRAAPGSPLPLQTIFGLE
ncbi:hypothetical protein F5883DRAFT_497981 [Diaporthe sp. PMI_573]|nr:hypothetical protein F5883DRAFT_497981 [Diaporthaceae sp. PMI_573]